MASRSIHESTNVQFLHLEAGGGDNVIYHREPQFYDFQMSRGSKAQINYKTKLWVQNPDGSYTERSDDESVLWSDYSMEYQGQFDRERADSSGLSVEEAGNILDMRVIKRIHGTAVNPMMFLKELDTNFSMVAKRSNQALQFLKNLKNPKKLAQLTQRYFRGTSRRDLTKRYTRAKRGFTRRAKKWGTINWSNSYLEYQFGWRPLCEDVWSLVGLAREAKRRNAQQSVQVGLSPQSVETEWDQAGPIGRPSDHAYASATTAGHVSITFEITDPWLRQGAALEPPAYSTWDSIPYSWLADCLTNVGDHLKYMLYTAGISLVSGYRSILRKTTCRIVMDPTVFTETRWFPYTSTEQYLVSSPITYTGVICKRAIYYEFPAVPWFNKVENTLTNSAVIAAIAAVIHQMIGNWANLTRYLYAR